MKWTNKGNQFKSYKELYTRRNRILLVGSLASQEYFLSKICPMFLKEVIDRDENEEQLISCHDETHLIVVSEFGQKGDDMLSRLLRAGYVRNVELFSYHDTFWNEIYSLNNPFLPLFGLYAMDKIYTSSTCVIPSTYCNLNCRDCLNFTPYLKKFESRRLDDVCEELDLMFRWIDFTERFQISGGEPLLYRELEKLIYYIGKNYRSKMNICELVINGTVVPSDELCKAFLDNDILLYLDNYVDEIPVELNRRDEIISKFYRFGIDWVDNTVSDWFALEPFKTNNSKKSDVELISHFDYCNNPWHNFSKGKMYSCNFSHFAMDAGIIKESENDFFDFRYMTNEKKPELVEFLMGYTEKGYVDFCKQCAGWGPNNKNRVKVAIQAERESDKKI